MSKITLNNVTVSDAYMALLADRGIDYWFANAGTDFAPVVETLAKAAVLETKVPTAITCPHENTAMHMAIGYFLVTGKPQAVMVHVNVGTANGMNGLLNAARGHVPVCSRRGARRPTKTDCGHRSLIFIDAGDVRSGGMLRESVKWDYELRNASSSKPSSTGADNRQERAHGPVYFLCRGLTQTMAEFTYTTPSRQHAAAPAFPNGEAVEELASLLAAAENPLIITSSAGRDPKAWSALAGFAERYAIPVIQYRNRYMSIPSNHPMNLGYELSPLLEKADVILAIDVPVPWLPAYDKVRDDAKVIHMGPDPLHGYVPVRGHP
jgi:acetolactate synthase-1/2/3 large subunit